LAALTVREWYVGYRTSTTPALDREFYLDHNVIEMIGEFEYLLSAPPPALAKRLTVLPSGSRSRLLRDSAAR
jgi:hypothetical protein